MGFLGLQLVSPDGTPFKLCVSNDGTAYTEDDQQAPVASMAPAVPTKALYTVHAEENGGIAAGQAEWSWGNGATGLIGQQLPLDGHLYACSLNAETATNGASAVIEVIDRSASKTGTVLHTFDTGALDASIPNSREDLDPWVAVTAGMVIGFRTVSVSGGSITDVRVFAEFLLTTPENPA